MKSESEFKTQKEYLEYLTDYYTGQAITGLLAANKTFSYVTIADYARQVARATVKLISE